MKQCPRSGLRNLEQLRRNAPREAQMFGITSKIIWIRLMVQYLGYMLRFALEDFIRHEEQNKMHVPMFGKLFMYNKMQACLKPL
jgi:hypothetical protein